MLGGRADRSVSVPLTRLFSPDPDPTEGYSGQAAEIDGYVVAPGKNVTIAVTTESPGGIDMLDSIWAALRRKGVGVRHLTVLNDRGRIVSLMTLHVDASEEVLRFLQSTLVVPVHTRDGFAEVHFLVTPEELGALQERIGSDGHVSGPDAGGPSPRAREAGTLQPVDWAFLGLLSVVGAFDGPEGPSPALVAEALGLDAFVFAQRARAVEQGLQDVVTGLFSPVQLRPNVQGVRS